MEDAEKQELDLWGLLVNKGGKNVPLAKALRLPVGKLKQCRMWGCSTGCMHCDVSLPGLAAQMALSHQPI